MMVVKLVYVHVDDNNDGSHIHKAAEWLSYNKSQCFQHFIMSLQLYIVHHPYFYSLSPLYLFLSIFFFVTFSFIPPYAWEIHFIFLDAYHY